MKTITIIFAIGICGSILFCVSAWAFDLLMQWMEIKYPEVIRKYIPRYFEEKEP